MEQEPEGKNKNINNFMPGLKKEIGAEPQAEQDILSNVSTPDSLPSIPTSGTPLPEKSMANVFGEIPTVSKRKISKKVLTILAVVFVLVATISGLIFVKGEELGILRPKPEKVLAEMLQNMEKAKTSHSEGVGQVIITNSAKPGQSVNVDFKMTTDEDSSDAENPKANLNYDVSLSMEGMSFTGNFDIKVADKTAYFRLNKAPLLPFADFGKFKGKWIKIDPKELEKNIEKLNPGIAGNAKAVESSEEMNAKIKEIVKKYSNNLIKIQKELPDETISGVRAFSYQIALDKETLKQFFNEFKAISKEINSKNNLTPVPGSKSSEEMQDKIYNEVINLISDKSYIKILVGKKDKLMYGAVFKMNITAKDFADAMSAVSGSSSSGVLPNKDAENIAIDLNFDIKYSAFNKPVEIKAPADAEDFMKALGIEESLLTAKQKANDARRQSDLQQIRTALVLYYDDNNGYPVTKDLEKTNNKNSAISKLAPNYISKVPVDPLDPNYYYAYKSNGKSYELSARAEDKSSTRCTKINESLCLFIVSGKDGF